MIFHYLWAKIDREDSSQWHPLILHLIDSAVVADVILEREPQKTKDQFSCLFGLSWEEARPWVLLLVACHDLGKACPGFQLKATYSTGNLKELLKKNGIKLPKLPNTSVNHNYVSQIAVEKLLKNRGLSDELSELCADAIGCHHGVRANSTLLYNYEGDRYGVDEKRWRRIWDEIFEVLCDVFKVKKNPIKSTFVGSDFIFLSGLTSFADWISSNVKWFSYGKISDCENPNLWFNSRKKNAENALNSMGWLPRDPLIKKWMSFEDAFPYCVPARPLQKIISEVVSKLKKPSVILIEAPMGEGKTEAAFYSHLELQRKFGHRGLYVALPTKATGNAMFERTKNFLDSFKRNLDLQLVHGGKMINKSFEDLCIKGLYDNKKDAGVRAGEWFTYKKRALLSEYGVGTIDQAILSVLPVRHYFVRMWGLANRVVVFDEIHSYDIYTGTLLICAICWLNSLGSSVILLSATLPPEFRRRLAKALDKELPLKEEEYPRLSVFDETKCIIQEHFEADLNRSLKITIKGISSNVESLKNTIEDQCLDDGFVGVIVNTVQRAQECFLSFGDGKEIWYGDVIVGKRFFDGTEVYLFHARYTSLDRQKREDIVLDIFGKGKGGCITSRSGRKILIATQVVEQSLDLDFDMMISDLAPIDLILQRSGRLWRHTREKRPLNKPMLFIAGLEGDRPGSFEKPLYWDKIYEKNILLHTWNCLKRKEKNKELLHLPLEIDSLVHDVYEKVDYPDDNEIFQQIQLAEVESEGNQAAQRSIAYQSIIGLPQDSSWKDANRYCFEGDEDDFTFGAQTRLGEESVTVIPFFIEDNFDPSVCPDFLKSKQFALRTVSLSSKKVVEKFRNEKIPKGWEENSLLRNFYPMMLDINGCWLKNESVKLDKELGIVYVTGEVK